VTLDARDAPEIQRDMAAWSVPFELLTPVGEYTAVARVDPVDLGLLSRVIRDRFRRCGGFRVHPTRETALEVEAELERLACDPQDKRIEYQLDNNEGVQALLAELEEDPIIDAIENLSAFHDRFYDSVNGVDAAHWIRDLWQTLTAGREDVQLSLYSHGGFPQPSVILRMEGTLLPDEVVVLGGHLDSALLFYLTGPAPGADDNASGIACLSEVIRAIVASDYRPERSLHFIGYAGEEQGLLGSGEIASEYASQGVQVVGVLQLDMTNYQGSPEDIWVIQDYTNSAQNTFLMQLLDAYLPDLTWSTTACGYGCSDHASWYIEGFASSMPSESRFGDHNPYIHTNDDTISVSGGRAEHALKFARLAATYIGELAKGGVSGGSSAHRVDIGVGTLLEVMRAMGPCDGACPHDLNLDGKVDTQDVAQLVPSWYRQTCLGFGQGPVCP